MRFGLILNTQFLAGESPVARLGELVEQVRAARDNGFDSISISHHYLLTPFQMLQPLSTAGRLAAEAGSMRLLTNIFLLTVHHPVYVAEQVATLDVITEGRFIFGVGLGYRQEEFDGLGVAMKTRVSRFIEVLEVAKRLWTEDVVSHQGEHFALRNAVLTLKPMQRPHPPIWIGASADPAVERAARYGDAWLMNPHATLGTLERQMALYRKTLDDIGKPLPREIAVFRECSIAKTREAALREARPYLERKYQAYADWGLGKPMREEKSLVAPYEALVRDRFIIGTPEECQNEIERFHRALGINHFLLRLQWPGVPQQQVLSQIDLLGRHVLPALTGSSGKA